MPPSNSPKIHDLLIIGAGAAGLACAHNLRRENIDILILEGRSRVGGRMHSETRVGSQTPIEFGPEFIHGAQPVTFDLLHEFGQSFVDVTENHHQVKNGKLSDLEDFFELMGKQMPTKKSKDESVADFLNRKKLTGKQKALFQSYIEGFHAADPTMMGTRGLQQAEETDDPTLNEAANFRPHRGYEAFIEAFSRELYQAGKIRLDHTVRKIEWQKHLVTVTCTANGNEAPRIFQARKLLITCPIGVLQQPVGQEAAIEWDPMPKVLQNSLKHLNMGHVVKLCLRFRERFWEDLKTKKPVSFVHLGPEYFFPTWWTRHPQRSGDLIAWQGGPRALEMADWDSSRILQTALQTLSVWAGMKPAALEKLLLSCDHHDWTHDPFSRGAYSYPGVGALAATTALRKSIDDTLFFAGEGTHPGSARGTVHGAIETGQRAADLIFKK